MADRRPALQMVNITKSFGSVEVLKGISFDVYPGEVHALLGENGAGKSTLMKILMGIHAKTSGRYLVDGVEVGFSGPADAQRNRVSMVYQEFGLVPYLSVTENIFMGRLPTAFGRVQWKQARQMTLAALAQVGSSVDPDKLVGDLKVADQQEVEIARALSYDPLIYIMDEPSAALSRVEIQNLYELVRLLKSKGVAIVYISHKLEEVFDLADRVTILRDGYVAGTHSTSDLTMATIVEEMTGRSIEATLRDEHRKPASDGEPLLEVKALTYEPFFEDVSITVPKGKIVGVAGVVGAGKSELARAIFGALPPNALVTGGLRFDGRDLRPSRMAPNKSRSLGIGFVTEDRKAEGFVPGQPVSFNILLPALRRVNALAFLLAGRMSQVVTRAIDEVKLRPRDPGKLVDELSGGNQQKVVIAKWLAAESRLIILDEPTRGIDVGARQEIYELMRKQAAENGAGMLVLSSDMREILVACDEIYLMVQGRIIDKIDPAAVTEHELIEMTLVREGAANVH